jgi:hypothetical protein
VLVASEHATHVGNVQTTKHNPLEDALAAYSRALGHHAFCVVAFRKYRNATFRESLVASASGVRWWHAYIIKWGKF